MVDKTILEIGKFYILITDLSDNNDFWFVLIYFPENIITIKNYIFLFRFCVIINCVQMKISYVSNINYWLFLD